MQTPKRSTWAAWLALAGMCMASVRAADVEYYGVAKSGVYTQTVTVAPAPLGTNAFQFIAFVIAAQPGAVTNATVRIPSSAVRQLSTNISEGFIALLAGDSDAVWTFTEEFPTAAAMDAVYPSVSGLLPSLSSRYTMNMSTVNDGQQNRELNYYLASVPSVPSINNLAAAQVIEPEVNFTLRWNAQPASLIPKIVFLSILDAANRVVLNSPLPFTEGALDGSSTSFVIPANTLVRGQTYYGTLSAFQPALPNTDYATGVIGHLRTTSFPLTPLPPPRPNAAQLRDSRMDGEAFVFEVILQPDQHYELQVSGDLVHWTTVQYLYWPVTTFLYRDYDAAGQARRFYRVIAP